MHRELRSTPSTDTSGITYQSFELRRLEELNKRFKGEIRDLQTANQTLQQRIDLLERIDAGRDAPPRWTRMPKTKGGLHKAIPVIQLSDWHCDEVVKPSEIEGVNKYNRKIAIKRLQYTIRGVVEMCKRRLNGLKYDGIQVVFGGDMFSGNIHEELAQTNEDTVLGSVDFWADHFINVLTELADEFGYVNWLGIVGNHGRTTKKPRYKLMVKDNYDWLLYRIIARDLRKDSRITAFVPESADATLNLYNTRIDVVHGNDFPGGGGISGIITPLLLGEHRTAKRQMSIGKPFHYLMVHHVHTAFHYRSLIVNGSGKGYDEYAYKRKFDYERPQQMLSICTPENSITMVEKIFCTERERLNG